MFLKTYPSAFQSTLWIDVRVIDYAKNVGCKVESTTINGKAIKKAILTAPLTFPTNYKRKQ